MQKYLKAQHQIQSQLYVIQYRLTNLNLLFFSCDIAIVMIWELYTEHWKKRGKYGDTSS